MAFEERSFIYAEGRDTDARHAEVIRTVVMPGPRLIVRLDRQIKIFGNLFYQRADSCALRTGHHNLLRLTQGSKSVIIQVERNIFGRKRRMLAQIF